MLFNNGSVCRLPDVDLLLHHYKNNVRMTTNNNNPLSDKSLARIFDEMPKDSQADTKLNIFTGEYEPSRLRPGYYPALFIKPRSLLKSNSCYRKLLAVLKKESWLSAQEIRDAYNALHNEPKKRTRGSIARVLARFDAWGLAIRMGEANTVKWSLQIDLDYSDGKALYDRALQTQEERKRQEIAELMRQLGESSASKPSEANVELLYN